MYNNGGHSQNGDNDFELSNYGGTGMTQYTQKQSIPAEMQIAWIQDPIKNQYRQMCNEIEPFLIPNN